MAHGQFGPECAPGFILHLASLLLFHSECGVWRDGRRRKVMSTCFLFCQRDRGLGASGGELSVAVAFPKPEEFPRSYLFLTF